MSCHFKLWLTPQDFSPGIIDWIYYSVYVALSQHDKVPCLLWKIWSKGYKPFFISIIHVMKYFEVWFECFCERNYNDVASNTYPKHAATMPTHPTPAPSSRIFRPCNQGLFAQETSKYLESTRAASQTTQPTSPIVHWYKSRDLLMVSMSNFRTKKSSILWN